MKTRRHHNNKALRQIKRCKTYWKVKAMAERFLTGKKYVPGNMDCGYDCHHHKVYGFVPEAGCPVHDV